MTVTIPQIPKNIRGVYALFFDTGYSYVGSSENIFNRWQSWKSALFSEKGLSPNVTEALVGCTNVRFEVVEIVRDDLKIIDAESYYLVFGIELNIVNNLVNKRGIPPSSESYKGRPIPGWDKFKTTKLELGYKIEFES